MKKRNKKKRDKLYAKRKVRLIVRLMKKMLLNEILLNKILSNHCIK